MALFFPNRYIYSQVRWLCSFLIFFSVCRVFFLFRTYKNNSPDFPFAIEYDDDELGIFIRSRTKLKINFPHVYIFENGIYIQRDLYRVWHFRPYPGYWLISIHTHILTHTHTHSLTHYHKRRTFFYACGKSFFVTLEKVNDDVEAMEHTKLTIFSWDSTSTLTWKKKCKHFTFV